MFIYDLSPSAGFGTVTAPRLLGLGSNRVAKMVFVALRLFSVAMVALVLAPILLCLLCIRLIAKGEINFVTDRYLKPLANIFEWAKDPLRQERRSLGLPPALIATNEAHGPKLGAKVFADVLVPNDVKETFEWKQRLIQTATQSLEWSFNFAGGEPFRLSLRLISEQMTKYPDLRVHLILSNDLFTQQDIEMLEELRKKYVNFFVLITSRMLRVTGGIRIEENHVKLLVVDGQYFCFGGSGVHDQMVREVLTGNEKKVERNLAAKVMDLCFRDSDIIGKAQTDDNIAETMRGQFFNLYRICAQRSNHFLQGVEGNYFPILKPKAQCEHFNIHEKLIHRSALRFIVSGPEHAGKNPINLALIQHFQEAKKVIQIASLLMNPSKIVLSAFNNSSAKKIGYFNSTKNYSLARLGFANLSRQNYHHFSRIYECDISNQLYHKKVVLMDDNIAYVGSYNFGIKSDRCDYEVMGIFEDKRVTAILQEGLDEDAKRSGVVVPPLFQSIRSRLNAAPFTVAGPLIF